MLQQRQHVRDVHGAVAIEVGGARLAVRVLSLAGTGAISIRKVWSIFQNKPLPSTNHIQASNDITVTARANTSNISILCWGSSLGIEGY